MKNLASIALIVLSLSATVLSLGAKGEWKKIENDEFFQHEWNYVVLDNAIEKLSQENDLSGYQYQSVDEIQFKFGDGMNLLLTITFADHEGIERHFIVQLFSQPWNKIVEIESTKEIQTLKSFKISSFSKGPGIQIPNDDSPLDKIINPFSKFANITEPKWKKQQITAINDESSLIAAQMAVQDKYKPSEEHFSFNSVVSMRQNVDAFNYVLSYSLGSVVQLFEVLVAKNSETAQFQSLICQYITQINGRTQSNGQTSGGWSVVSTSQFMQSNANIVPIALQAINTKYDPQAQGFQYDNVIQVQSQMVAGVNYELVIQYSNGKGQIQIYDVILYDVPWSNSVTVTSCDLVGQYNAKPQLSTEKENIEGGWTSQNSTQFGESNSNILNVANDAIQQNYNPEQQGYQYSEVTEVNTQVVAGINYNLVIQYTNSDGEAIYYNVVIYDCPWTNSTKVISCQQQDEEGTLDYMGQKAVQSKMMMTDSVNGGWTKVNPNAFTSQNSDVLSVAQQAVATQYNPEASGYNYSGVQSVNQQVVAGMNYDIVLVYTNSNGESEYFDVVVYDVPWSHQTQVTSCTEVQQPHNEMAWSGIDQVPEEVMQRAKEAVAERYSDKAFESLQSAMKQGRKNSSYILQLKYSSAEYLVTIYVQPGGKSSETVNCFRMRS